MSQNNDSNSFTLKTILEKEKVNGSNFMDWHRNLRIVLRLAKKLYVLESPILDEPQAATDVARRAWDTYVQDSLVVTCLMHATMTHDLQKNLEDITAYDMIEQLKSMFQVEARQERYDVMKQLISCKMHDGSSVSTRVLKMKSFVDQLAKLGFPLSNELAGDIILNSLPKSYDQFVMNYNMNGWEKSLQELHLMLKTTKVNIPMKTNPVLMIKGGGVKKPKANGKGNKGKKGTSGKSNTKGSGKQAAKVSQKDHQCFHCNEMGHWKRNCPKYLGELKKNKASEAVTSGTKEV